MIKNVILDCDPGVDDAYALQAKRLSSYDVIINESFGVSHSKA